MLDNVTAPPIAKAGAPDFAALRLRVARRYRGRFAQGFVAGKLRGDPVSRAVLDRAVRAPLGRVVDLGCGRGQLGLALLEAGGASSVIGIDWDRHLLADARAAAVGVEAQFREGDLKAAPVPPCDTVLIIDALVQMPAAAQLALLRRAAVAERQVLVRTFDPDRRWRSAVGLAQEAGLWLSGKYRRASIRPVAVATLTAVLEEAGFACTVEPCWGWTPLPNVLLVATRHRRAA